MEITKKKLSQIAGKTSGYISPAIKKAVVSAVAFSALAFGAGNSVSAAGSDLTTVYYVYANDTFIGTVSDKNVIEKLVADKINEAEKHFEGIELTLNKEITYIPEQVFKSSSPAENGEAVGHFQDEIGVQAEAAAVSIDGNPVAYVQSAEAAEDVLKSLKLQYISEDELKEAENLKQVSKDSLPPLEKNETRILDVKFSKEVSVSAEKVDPAKILTKDDTLKLLKNGTLEEQKYTVKEGDVLGGIANSHGLTLKEMLSLNPGTKEDTVLKIGEQVKVTVLKPLIELTVEKETYRVETVPYKREVENDSSMPKGDSKVKQEGKEGSNGVSYAITEVNGQTVKRETVKTEVLEEPVTEITVKGTKVIPSRGDGTFAWPASGGYISSQQGYRWGKLHKGIDIARPSNYNISAADNGVVVYAGYDGGYGNKIIIDHQNGYKTIYAHLASMSVGSGQTVARGSKIGVMGATGDSTGIHLHFEVFKNGKLVNPVTVLR